LKYDFREASPQDAPAISAFLGRVLHLDSGAPLVEARHLHWKCWQDGPYWTGSRGYVVTRGEEIAAYASVVPLVCLAGERQLRMAHLIDWTADPASVGSGVILMKRIAQMVDAIVFWGGSESTEKVVPALGAKACGDATRFALPLKPLRRLAAEGLHWRTGVRAARGVLWKLQAPFKDTAGWSVTPVEPHHLGPDVVPLPKPKPNLALFERTWQMLAYFLRCPGAQMALFTIAKSGPPRGYFLLARTLDQIRIADFYIESDDPEDWRVLIELAVREAQRSPSGVEVISVGSDAVTRRALLGGGFRSRGSWPLRLLSKNATLPNMPIRFHMIDNDAAFWHENRSDYWG